MVDYISKNNGYGKVGFEYYRVENRFELLGCMCWGIVFYACVEYQRFLLLLLLFLIIDFFNYLCNIKNIIRV